MSAPSLYNFYIILFKLDAVKLHDKTYLITGKKRSSRFLIREIHFAELGSFAFDILVEN